MKITDSEMPTIREALNSRKLNPCFTLIIFSFMVSFTLSILDLILQIQSLHLPVLIMWLITISSVALTVGLWYCRCSSCPVLKRLQDGSPERYGRNRELERSFLSRGKQGTVEPESVNYGTDCKSEATLSTD